MSMMDTMTTISTYAVNITTIGAAAALICKPFRKLIVKIWRKIAGERKNISDEVGDKIDAMEQRLTALIDTISEKCDTNERDRLKQIIFSYGNYARKRQKISSEEFRYLQQCFEKYTNLGGNDIAHSEFDFVTDYYNRQGWRDDG